MAGDNDYDLRVNITGDGQSLRDDIEEDIASVDALQEKLDEVDNKDVALNVETADAEANIEAVKTELVAVEDKTIDLKLDDSEFEEQLAAAEEQPTDDKVIDLKLNDDGYYEAMTEVEEQPTTDKVVKLKLDDSEFETKLAADEAELETETGAHISNPTKSIPTPLNVSDSKGLTLSSWLRSLFGSSSDKEEKIPTGGFVGQLIDSLGSANLDNSSELQKTETQLDRVKSLLNEIGLTHATIHVDDEKAQDEVDKLKSTVDDLVYRALKISVDDTDAIAKVKELHADIAKLRAAYAKIPIGVEDGSAVEKIDAIKMDLDTLHGKTIDVKVKETDGKNKPFKGFTLPNLLMGVSPLAAPVGASALGAIGGLASAFTSAGVGAAGFAAVAVTDLDKVFKAAEGTKEQLNGMQEQALSSLKGFESFWSGFAASFDKPVMQVFIDGLKGLQSLLVDLKPAISGAANAFAGLMSEWDKSLSSNTSKSIFAWLGKEAGPMITDFGKSAGNVFMGVLSLMKDFAPLANEMGEGFVKMSANFASWAANLDKTQGFQSFIKYVETEGPKVLQTIGKLGSILGQLLKDAALIGDVLLKIVDGVAGFADALLKGDPLLGTLIAGIISAIGWFKMLAPILAAIDLLDPFTWVVVAVAAVAVGVTEIITHWKQVKTFLEGLWTDLKTFFDTWGPELLAVIAPFIGIPLVIEQNWGAITKWFSGLWQTITSDAQSAWDSLSTWFTSTMSSIVQGIEEIWKTITGWFTTLWKTIESDAKTWWGEIAKALTTLVTTAYDSITNVFQDLGKWFSKIWNDVLGGLSTGWNAISSSLSSLANTAYNDITNQFDKLEGYFKNLWQEAFQWGENLVNSIAQGIESAIKAVGGAASKVGTAIEDYLGFHSPSRKGPGSEADTWMPNLMNMLTDGIQQGAPKLKAALNSALSMPKLAVSSNVSSMVTGGSSTLRVEVSGAIQHTGKVQSDGLTSKAITQINQQLNTQVLRKSRY